MRLTSILVIISLSALFKAEQPDHGKIVVCPILPQHILDFFGNEFNVDEADLSVCSHLMVFEYDEGFFFANKPEKPTEEDFTPITSLRNKYPYLKITLCKNIVNFFKRYMDIVNGKNPTKNFFEDAVRYVQNHDLDGINLNLNDIEETLESLSDIKGNESTVHKTDTVHAFMKELKKQFKKRNLLVTMSFTATTHYFADDFNLCEFVRHVDWLIFSSTRMDFPSKTFKSDAIQHAIMEFQPSSVRQKIDDLISSGVRASKIVLGIEIRTVYGMTTYGKIDKARTLSYVGYNKLCELSVSTGTEWERRYDDGTELYIMARQYMDTISRDIFLFKTSQTVADDVKFIRSRHLAGASIFPISMDDFKGECSQTAINPDASDDGKANEGPLEILEQDQATLPFLRAISKELFAKENQIEDKFEEAKNLEIKETGNQNGIVNKANQTNQNPSGGAQFITGTCTVLRYSVGISIVLIGISICLV